MKQGSTCWPCTKGGESYASGCSSPSYKASLDESWDVLLKSTPHLRLNTLDFSDLWEDEDPGLDSNEDGDVASEVFASPVGWANPTAPPPPPLPPPPPPPCPMTAAKDSGATPTKGRTLRLYWNELCDLPTLPKVSRFGKQTIWATLEPVNVDTNQLQHLFESKSGGLAAFKCKASTGQKQLNVLELKRSNIINITLSSLPPPHIIREAVVNMDQSVLDREDLQKLVSLIPTEEELLLIKEAQKKNPSLPLGSAEQSLLTLGSVQHLSARLELWAFMLDYENLEREIAEPLFNLKLAMQQLVSNKTFRCILATVLAIGNFLNGCKAKGFELGYLEKLPEVRDTVSRQPLLHHTCTILVESFPETTDLHSEIPALTKSARVDFSQLHSNLEQLEARCKASGEHLKVIGRREGGGRLKSQLGAFVKDSTQRVSILRAVYRRVINRFHSFLLFLGYPRSAVKEMSAGRFCKTVSDFALEYRTSRAHILQRKERHREREGCNGSVSASPSTPHGGDPTLQQHQNMKEVLSTPEISRRLDLSLPRPRHKNRESTGTGPGKLKTQ
ncbi:FH1/FH2 domain-containing protein 3-like [Polyodon spathula]|uniref:FH1/FH2 domain-containing protein 3-like n=1 Tax=Polyodon spathula TaxID=7913 RepID=UPI001B7F33A9|nr:FH1/FH2 domain-containing protein 3-like [Polyodon spathula]